MVIIAYCAQSNFDGINTIRNIKKTENSLENHSNFFIIDITNFLPLAKHPRDAQAKEIKSLRDSHFGYDKKIKQNRHYKIRNNFSMMLGKK